jgi:uncharacterized protein YkwD/plastocyanin
MAGALAVAPPAAAAPLPPRPVPPPVTVHITDAGYDPATITLAIGQTVEFDNTSTASQTVTADDATFDSGEIPAGGAYSMALGGAGAISFHSGDNPNAKGLLTVGAQDLPGAPGDTLTADLPDIPIPPMTDLDENPLGFAASRGRVLVMFSASATVGDAEAAIAAVNGAVVGTIPGLDAVLVQLETEPSVGDFDPIDAALATLRANPAVDSASLDKVTTTAVAPPPTDQAANGYSFDDPRLTTAGAPSGTGTNWGLESARFPSAWNVVDAVRLHAAPVDTLVYDLGFETDHPDLPIQVRQLCDGFGGCTENFATDKKGHDLREHGTHVAGIIGAAWDNGTGVAGANPAAHLYGVAYEGNFSTAGDQPIVNDASFENGATTSANWSLWEHMLSEDRPGGDWPHLRVINMSSVTMMYTTVDGTPDGVANWGTLNQGRHCGLGTAPDGVGTNAPCTPNNDNSFLNEVKADGTFALKVAQQASAKGVLLTVASGNDSNKICESATDVAAPAGGNCPAGFTFSKLDTRATQAFGWADAHWSGGSNPILMTDAVDINNARAKFSNIGGDVSAPGVNILSTVTGHKYKSLDGTSMAAPFVAGLAGLLWGFNPNLTLDQVRSAIISAARPDTTDGAAPRIDAYGALLRVNGALHALADWNDPSADGNRRVIRDRNGTETPDLTLGSPSADPKITFHTSPDGQVDMRDFRRFRDAQLEVCTLRPGVDGCPPASAIALDGTADSPKRDLNFDGCGPATASCGPEEAWSRFDLNGDGRLAPNATEKVPTGGGDVAMTDLDMFRSVYDEGTPGAEGWTTVQLPTLMRSGDLEIHADPMFEAGATKVDVEVKYGASGTAAPARSIDAPGGSIIVTVPTPDDDGTPVTIVGHATVNGKQFDSDLDTETLKTGADARVDLCVPTLKLSAPAQVLADGTSQASVDATVNKCPDTQKPQSAAQVEFTIRHAGDASPTTATLSAPDATTDDDGHATVKLSVGNKAEDDVIDATASVASGGDTITIKGSTDIDLTTPPHLIYRWEQTITDWSSHEHFYRVPEPAFNDPGDDQTIDLTGTTPTVISRAGTVTPIGTTDAHVVEDVPVNTVNAHKSLVDTLDPSKNYDGPATESIPVVDRHHDLIASLNPTNVYNDDETTKPVADWTYGQTSFDTGDAKITVHHFNDIANFNNYGYSPDPDSVCDPNNLDCFPLSDLDQVALVQRANGSALEYASDLTKDLTFAKLPDGSWSTYNYCGPTETLPIRGKNISLFDDTMTGSATFSVRFVAQIVTDDTDPSTLQFGNCSEPKPPIAAIARTPSDAQEGQLVHFVDASYDPNGDIVQWQWDFGDGSTSTDQFPDHRYADNGTYTVKLTVTDATGNSDSYSVDETVENVAPTLQTTDAVVDSGQAAAIQFTAFDPGTRDAEALTLSITPNDSTLGQFPPVTVPAGTALYNIGILPDGPHDFTATLTDKDGASATSTFTVHTGDQTTGTVEPQDDIEREPAPQCSYGVKLDINENDFVDQLTQYRKTNGVPMAYPSPTLTDAAETQAEYLRDNDLWSHTGANGSTPADRAKAASYPGTLVGENLVRGATTALQALTAFQLSPSHDANQLNAKWNAIGVARVKTTHGWLWDIMFGNVLDCPSIPPDLNPGNNVPPPMPQSPPNPPIEVLAWTNLKSAAAPTPADAVTPPSNPNIPVTAFVITNVAPTAGSAVTVTNRSSETATFDPGDGRPGQNVAPGISIPTAYLDPGTNTASFTLGSWTATMNVVVGGTPTPPMVANAGPTTGAQGATVTVGANVTTAAAAPVIGRTVKFALGAKTATGVTDANGHATAPIHLDIAAGPYNLQIDVPALAGGGTDASIAVPFTVTANAPPVAKTTGPYDVLINDTVNLDAGQSFDPDGFPVTASWDLNNDGTFGDSTELVASLSGAAAATEICGGTCLTEHPYTVAVRITDKALATDTTTTTVTFHRDFGLQVSPSTITLNPGGSASLQVTVLTTSGFAQPVALSVPNLPAGVTAQFSSPSVTPNGQSLLSLSAAPNAAKLDQPITVRGTSGALVRDATGTVDVELGLVPQCFTALNLHVVDDETNQSLAGVFVPQAGGSTDANGFVQIGNIGLPPGNGPTQQFVSANDDGYFPFFGQQVVGCGVVTTLEVRMVPIHTGRLVGHVFAGTPDPNDHRSTRTITPTSDPLTGAQISVPFATAAVSDSNGAYAINDVQMTTNNQPRVAFAQTSLTGYWIAAANVTVNPDQTTTFDWALVKKCTGSADIRVLDATTHKPIAGLGVSVFTPDGTVGGTTGADGTARINGVVLGTNNSSVVHTAEAQGVIDGFSVVGDTQISLFDCGSVAVADITVQGPIQRFASVQGTVTDNGGTPLAGVQVSVSANALATATTDGAGHYNIPTFRYAINGPASEQVQVNFLAPNPPNDHWNAEVDAALNDGQSTTVDAVLLRKKHASLSGTVTDAVTGQVIAGASLNGPAPVTNTESGTDGTFRFDNIDLSDGNTPRQVGVIATLPGYWQGSQTATISADQDATANVTMLRKCAPVTIEGTVFNAATGAPLDDVLVSDFGGSVFSDASGHFTLPPEEPPNNNPLGDIVSASKPGFFTANRSVTVFCGAHLIVDFGDDATGLGTVHGKVTRASDGSPLAGVSVGGDWGKLTTTAADGTYSFTNVPIGGEPGNGWPVHVQAPIGSGLADATKSVIVSAGADSALDFQLDGSHNHKPVADAQHIDASPDDVFVPVTLTGHDPDGDPITFRIFGVTGGSTDGTANFPDLRFFPDPGVTDAHFFVVATDGSLDSDPAEITISVNGGGGTSTTTTSSSTSTSSSTTSPSSTSSTSSTTTTSTSTTSTSVPGSTTTSTSTTSTSSSTSTSTTTSSTSTSTSTSTTTTSTPSTTSTSTSSTSTSTTSTTPTTTVTEGSTTTTSTAPASTTTTEPGASTTTTPSTVAPAGSTTSIASETSVPPSTAIAGTGTGSGSGSSGSPLPFTGGDSRTMTLFALACLVAGGVLARRRRHMP